METVPPLTFDRAFRFVVGEEGGYVNDPMDPGGQTKFGISKRSYPMLNIPTLSLEDAKGIYRRDYWDRLALDGRVYGDALCIFDCAINQGVGAATLLLHQVTARAAFVVEFQAERALRYAKHPKFSEYGRGWMRRLLRTTIEAQGDQHGTE